MWFVVMSFFLTEIIGQEAKKRLESNQNQQKYAQETQNIFFDLKKKMELSKKGKKVISSKRNELRVIVSPKDNMPCLIPDGNFNMPVMKIDTATKYAMRIGKIN